MNKSHLLEFATRDWSALEELQSAYWAERKRVSGAAEAILVCDELRRHAQRLHPDWPTEEDRRQDTETHARVAASLRRVVPTRHH